MKELNNEPTLNPYIDLNFSFQDTDKFAIENTRESEYWKYHENSSYYNFKVKVTDVFSVIYYRWGTDENCRPIHEFRKKFLRIHLVDFKLNIRNMKLIMGKIFPFVKIILNLLIIILIFIMMKEIYFLEIYYLNEKKLNMWIKNLF